MNYEDGFSGLEGAIVLIAFVVVASVFAYATLGSGFFVSDKAQQSVQEGTKTAAASVYQEGGLYGTLDSNGQLDKLSFTIYVPDEGMDQDLTQMIISYTQSDISDPKEFEWSKTGTDSTHFYAQGRELLQEGQNVRIDLADVKGPTSGGWFAIEIRPKRGSTLFIKRWLSAGYDGGVII
jgi:flagellin FlaB